MAKRKKSSGKISKCPEPINTMIDLAAGLTMGAVASRMEKKYNYSKKGKINPYSVSAVGLATGRIKNTKDILRTGAILGALGSFDVDADDEYDNYRYTSKDPVFREMRDTKVNDNRYAWRFNCEDGGEFGVYPECYESKGAYLTALALAKGSSKPSENTPMHREEADEISKTHNKMYIYVRVSRLDNGLNEYYLSDNNEPKVGDIIQIPTDKGAVSGVVLSVEKYSAENAPQPPEETLLLE